MEGWLIRPSLYPTVASESVRISGVYFCDQSYIPRVLGHTCGLVAHPHIFFFKKFVCFDSSADRGSSSRVVLAVGWVPTDHGFQSLLSLQWAWMLNVLRLCWCRSGFEFFLAAMRSV